MTKQREAFEKWLKEYSAGKPYWSDARRQICFDAWQASQADRLELEELIR